MTGIARVLGAVVITFGIAATALAQEGFPVNRNPPAGLFTTTGALKGNGSGVVTQAACADLSNAAASCSTDTTNASNISSGSLAAARMALPYFSAAINVDQTVTASTPTKIQFSSVSFNSPAWYDGTTNYRYTPLLAGKYRITVSLSCAGTTITQCQVTLRKNGSDVRAFALQGTLTNGAVDVSTILDFNGTTDYVEAWGVVNGTGTLTFVGTFSGVVQRTWFDAQYISP